MLNDPAQEPKKMEGRPGDTGPLTMAHILFMDVVGYSRLSMERQRTTVRDLQRLVVSCKSYRESDSAGQLVCRPTGDGMALAFFHSLLTAVRCAQEIALGLKAYPHIRLRMGIHSGHVYRVRDGNNHPDVLGEGINTAQRVMDCGDVDHILLSGAAAQLLQNLDEWKYHIHDVGEFEVKHGEHIHLYSLYTNRIGNRRRPGRAFHYRRPVPALSDGGKRLIKFGLLAAVLGGGLYAVWPYLPDAPAYLRSVWLRVANPSPKQTLTKDRSSSSPVKGSPVDRLMTAMRAARGEERWGTVAQQAQRVMSLGRATREQRAEALYHLASAAYHRADYRRAATYLKRLEPLSGLLPLEFVSEANRMRVDIALMDAQSQSEAGKWSAARQAASRALRQIQKMEREGGSDDLQEEAARAYYLAAHACLRQGDRMAALKYVDEYKQRSGDDGGEWGHRMMEMEHQLTALSTDDDSPSEDFESDPAAP